MTATPARPLTTTQIEGPQMYFPGNGGNTRDSWCVEDLLLEIEDTPSGKVGHFDFVVR